MENSLREVRGFCHREQSEGGEGVCIAKNSPREVRDMVAGSSSREVRE